MKIVILTALGVGGATVLGASLGFLFQKKLYKYSDAVNAFSAGLMTVAAVVGLILPSREYGGYFGSCVGIMCGALCLYVCDRCFQKHGEQSRIQEAALVLFLAIAIHNLPEGMAAGVGLGADNGYNGIRIALEIALQNIPEGMVIIGPMLASGMSAGKTFVLAVVTGIIEVFGGFMGYYSVELTSKILPFTLSYAGGMMLYVICSEMIPETCQKAKNTFFYILGFIFMLIFDGLV